MFKLDNEFQVQRMIFKDNNIEGESRYLTGGIIITRILLNKV